MPPSAFMFRRDLGARMGWSGAILALIAVVLFIPILLVLFALALVVGLAAMIGGVVIRALNRAAAIARGGSFPGASSAEGRRNVRVVTRRDDDAT